MIISKYQQIWNNHLLRVTRKNHLKNDMMENKIFKAVKSFIISADFRHLIEMFFNSPMHQIQLKVESGRINDLL
jgi:hypothetical protein